MTPKKVSRVILIDEPTSKDFFHGKGHERTAQALATAIKTFKTNDRAIGLDGPWGSGKSSVVAIAQKSLNITKPDCQFHFFTFDIWSSQGASFRRSFLEHFVRWAREEFPKKRDVLNDIDNEVNGKTKVISSSNKSILDWYGIFILLFVPVLPMYYFWAKGYLDSGISLLSFMSSAPLMVFYGFLALTFVRSWLKFGVYSKNSAKGRDETSELSLGRLFQMAVSQTLLISSKSYEDQRVTEHIREVDPNDFEFQATFRRILATLQDDKRKIVVVLDNIDRLPKDEIDDYWALVRSVFSRGSTARKVRPHESITAIVPYDRHLIGTTDVLTGDAKSSGGPRSIKSREIFSKTFDEILIVAPPVMSNSKEFFQEKILSALPGFDNEDELSRVYLIFNQMILKENGKATPRQIISFINELTGIYVLHEGRIGLPTVAVFIAHQDELELNPTKLTIESYISDRLKTIASDPNIERNLAALIFNVEPDLAFQILLDDQIRSASVRPTPEALAALAVAPGFDLRVEEVIAANVREWQEAGDFGVVITNFAALVKIEGAVGRSQYLEAIVAAFSDLTIIGTSATEYEPYLRIFEMARPSRSCDVAKHFISCCFNSMIKQGAGDVRGGVGLAKVILAVHAALAGRSMGETQCEFLPTYPSELEIPRVIFGLAQHMHASSVSFSALGINSLQLGEDDAFFTEMAVGMPEAALKAFKEFHAADLMKEDAWVAIGNALVSRLVAEEIGDGDEVSSLVQLLNEAWTCGKQTDIDLKVALTNANLYLNLKSAFGDNSPNPGFDAALSLFGREMIVNGYKVGHPGENSPEYSWLAEIVHGETSLLDEGYGRIASLVVRSMNSGKWTEIGRDDPTNKFLSNVVRNIYLGNEIPSVSFKTFVDSYEYIGSTVEHELPAVFEKLSGRASKENFDFVTLDNVPLDLIRDSHDYGREGWRPLFKRIDELLDALSDDNWSSELDSPSGATDVLFSRISAGGFRINSNNFKSSFTKFVSDVLNCKKVPSAIKYDEFLGAINPDFYPDMYRKVRDSLDSVTSNTLTIAHAQFPKFLDGIVSGGDRIRSDEKDSIVRNVLAPALEARNSDVLGYFISLGTTRVRDYVKSSNASTQKLVNGAEKTFHNGHKNYAFAESIADLLHGKRKARSILDVVWNTGSRED